MATIKELKKWLENFDEEATVLVGQSEAPKTAQDFGEVHLFSPNLEDTNEGEGWTYKEVIGGHVLLLGDFK